MELLIASCLNSTDVDREAKLHNMKCLHKALFDLSCSQHWATFGDTLQTTWPHQIWLTSHVVQFHSAKKKKKGATTAHLATALFSLLIPLSFCLVQKTATYGVWNGLLYQTFLIELHSSVPTTGSNSGSPTPRNRRLNTQHFLFVRCCVHICLKFSQVLPSAQTCWTTFCTAVFLLMLSLRLTRGSVSSLPSPPCSSLIGQVFCVCRTRFWE